ncbi:hypothetical protein CLCR_04462 [Cladophialophora carrionii]|uniref:Uncharacterized protein n=1 Tax=Cladophialophora carrionii TaxID=86049 RepID=A0A1C1CJ81_9EURO|nr:hypothetical protein CLCR_04462 [Cladophialophora carrionii]
MNHIKAKILAMYGERLPKPIEVTLDATSLPTPDGLIKRTVDEIFHLLCTAVVTTSLIYLVAYFIIVEPWEQVDPSFKIFHVVKTMQKVLM